MPGDEEILKIEIDDSDLNPALILLQKIDAKLNSISKNSKVFNTLGKGVASANKELKKTDSLFESINKKMKLSKLMAGVGGAFKSAANTLGMGALFSVGGLFASAVMGAQGSIASTMTGKRLGIGAGQFQALKYAGKMTGHSEEQLATVLMHLNETFRNPEKWGALAQATGGLKAQELRKKDPTEAMFEIFDNIKNSKLAKSPEMIALLGENLSQIGINLDDFREVLDVGASEMRSAYGEGLGLYSKVNMNKLVQGDKALTRFQTNLDIVSKEVGAALAPAMDQALKALGPLLVKLGEILAALISKITPEDVERFGEAIEGFINFFVKTFGGKKEKWNKPESDTDRLARRQKYIENVKGVFTGKKKEAIAEQPIKVAGNIIVNVQKAEDAGPREIADGVKKQVMPTLQGAF